MNLEPILERMERFPGAVTTLLHGTSPEDARWRPPGGQWSLIEIVEHLVDEEREDFRQRLRLTLEDPSTPWPPIDPEGAPAARGYQERDLTQSLANLMLERAESVAWLRGLESPSWECAHEHPVIGALRAGDLLLSWAAHDALHLRQIAARLLALAERDAQGYTGRYAGPW